MQRLFGKKSTFKPVKAHQAGSKRDELHQYTRKTLGSGNMRMAVALPEGEDLNEWMAVNTVDFFNEVSLLYGIVMEEEMPAMGPGEGFPPGFEYLWADGVRVKTPVRCSGPEYVDYVMTWVEEQINNDDIFPGSADKPFPRNFQNIIKQIFTRLFRVFAIIYNNHFSKMERLGAVAHLNTSFKHFIFFSWEFDLVERREMDALASIVGELRDQFEAQAF
jgi:MOB kinase activator 1